MLKFLVVSPQPSYIPYIGGITVTHTLANYLHLFGEEVYLYANSTKPEYSVQCIPHGSIFDLDQENTIVILIAGAGEHTYLPNMPKFITEAKYIVRWLVNDQVKSYPKNNKFYKYHKYWNTFDSQQIDGYLSVIDVDKNLFHNRGLQRTTNCFLIKGNLDEEPERFINDFKNDICIDNYLYSIPHDQTMNFLSDVFNSCKSFISYTPFTFASVLASLCGCVSIVIPKSKYGDKNFDKNKWMTEMWCTKYGTAVGLEDIPRAIETMPLVESMIDDYINITQKTQIKEFIKDCYLWKNQ
jgi:hypothetical protein